MTAFRHARTGVIHAAQNGFVWSFCGLANAKAGLTHELTLDDVECKACRRRVEEEKLKQR